MKKVVLIIISLLILTAGKANANKDYILLTGTISNASEEKFQLVHKDGKGKFSITIEKDGSFICDTITSGTGTYRFAGSGLNRIEIYLTNGGEYKLNFVEKEMVNTAVLTGPVPNPSIYLMTKGARLDGLRGDFQVYKKLNPTDYKAKATMIKNNLINYLDSFPNMPNDFVQFERQELINHYLLYLIQYEYLHGQVTGQLATFRVSDDFLEELKGVDFTNEKNYKQRGYYSSMVKEYFELKAKRLSEKEGSNYNVTELKVFGAIPNDYIKNDLLKKSAGRYLSEITNIDDYYKTFLSVSTSKENSDNVTKRYNELKKVSKGAPAPVFSNYINHAGGKSSLGDFKGKYVYIDMWATWCGPCLAEVPFLKEVEKKYHGKNIAFVSISIDTNEKEKAWRKMVTDKELSGVQLLAIGDWNSTIIKDYQIIAIPRFILIDPEGKIIEANAPNPSSPDLIDLFNQSGI